MSKNDSLSGMKRAAVGALLGAAVTAVLTVIFLTLPAMLVASGRVGEGAQGAMAVAAAFLASCAGALTARLWSRQGALAACLGTALITVAVRWAAALLLCRSGGVDRLDVGVCAAVFVACAAVGAVRRRRRRFRR